MNQQTKQNKKKNRNRRLENVIYEFKHNRQAMFAAIYLTVVVLISLLVVLVPGLDPDAIDVTNQLQPPSLQHWFGTDNMGRDYFARVLYGGRISLVVGVLAMLTCILFGVIVGTVSGYFGGLVDSILMRIVDVFQSIPWIIMVTVVGIIFKKGLFSIIFVIGLFSWMPIARLVRSEVLSSKEREYVQYAKFIGVRSFTVMLQHVLPSVFPTIITAATAAIANAIMTESSLSFLGLGIQQPMSSWGSLLQQAQQYLQMAPYMAILPGILIILTVYSFNKLGDVLRVFVEPRVQAGESDG
ncbi:MAG TPA: ABC transporter permease [Candidatus Ventrimonas merdavium]|nr:ABC transporter permease [Candidatus Ventrimonas merdavium]